jgi:hypothetical protein
VAGVGGFVVFGQFIGLKIGLNIGLNIGLKS